MTKHLVGIILTAMGITGLPALVLMCGYAVTHLVLANRPVEGVVMFSIGALHFAAAAFFGTRLLRHGPDFALAAGLFVALLVPTVVAVALARDYLTRAPDPGTRIIV